MVARHYKSFGTGEAYWCQFIIIIAKAIIIVITIIISMNKIISLSNETSSRTLM